MCAILSAFNASYKIPPPSKASHANRSSQHLELWLLKQQWVASSWSCSRTPRTSCYPLLAGSSCREAPQGARLSQLQSQQVLACSGMVWHRWLRWHQSRGTRQLALGES